MEEGKGDVGYDTENSDTKMGLMVAVEALGVLKVRNYDTATKMEAQRNEEEEGKG